RSLLRGAPGRQGLSRRGPDGSRMAAGDTGGDPAAASAGRAVINSARRREPRRRASETVAQLTLEETNDCSGMLNRRDAGYTLKPNEARYIRNIFASPSGEAILRGGYDLWGDTNSGAPVRGIHRFYTPTLTHLLAASGTGIYVDTGS